MYAQCVFKGSGLEMIVTVKLSMGKSFILVYYCHYFVVFLKQEEYQREGIQWKNIEFIDNTGSLELFSKRPGGLFCLLDEECG